MFHDLKRQMYTHKKALRSVWGALLFLWRVYRIWEYRWTTRGCVYRLWLGGLVQGCTSLLDFVVFWTCEVFRLTYTNTTSCFVDSNYPKIFVRLVRLLLRPLELDSWTETNYWLPQGNVCLMILCTRCLWCVWRKLTIIRQRLFFEALGITVISNHTKEQYK